MVIETADLLVDVFFSFLAVYLVDVAGADPAHAALAISLFSVGGIAGSALILPMLPRYDGLNYLRTSAIAAAILFPLFLVIDSLVAKIAIASVIAALGAGWYTIPKARLFSALPGRSGIAVAVESGVSFLGSQSPLLIGAVSAAFGLGPAMWLLMAGPVSILLLVPRPRSRSA
jgi:FSR family fosmidomycin resistance protein-like MFS transporter